MKKAALVLAAVVLLAVTYGWISQQLLSHEDATFTPDYAPVELTADTDPQTLFRQTGLSPAAVRTVLENQGIEGLQAYQEAFFAEKQVDCHGVFAFFVKQDNLVQGPAPTFAAVEAGDLVVSLSPHSAGWRHGHGALILTDGAMVQLTRYGTRSGIYNFDSIRALSQYAVLRLKDRPEDFPEAIFTYTLDHLLDVPYSILSGKTPDPDALRLMCTSLVWYPYHHFGYDIDSDGGWFVSARDILDSPFLEVVQVYGMDPEEFMDRMAP